MIEALLMVSSLHAGSVAATPDSQGPQAPEGAVAPEVALAIGLWPSTLAIDAYATVPFFDRVDAGARVSLGPMVIPFPVTLTVSDVRWTAMEVDGRLGLYAQRRWWLPGDVSITPGVDGIVRMSYQHLAVLDPTRDVDRSVNLFSRWLEARVRLHAEWRPGPCLGIRWLDPLGIDLGGETVVNGPYAAFDQSFYNASLKWAFVGGRP